jgi:hypothetical protein
MFTADLRRQYEQTDGLAGSGSRPVIDTFVNARHRDVRFMPRTAGPGEWARFAAFTHGVRQVVRRQGRLEPAF